MTKKITSLLSIVAISALTIGCGNSSTTPVKSQEKTTGTVIDDYIKDATVCVDVNNNGERDSGDTPCAQTNATGQFTFNPAISGSLVMSGGTDVGTGKPFTGTYSAPAGSTVVTPLTTIVQEIVKSGKSVAEAQTIIKTSLGLPDVDLSTYDPIATLDSGTAAEVEAAKTVFAQQSSIQTILTTVASTIAASVTGSNEDDLTNGAAAQLAALMNVATPTAIDIADTDNVTTIINATATAESTTVDATLVTALAAQVNATSDQVVSDITTSTGSIGDIRQAAAQVAEVVQNNATAVATALVAGTAIDTIVSTATTATTNLSTAIDDAAANVTTAASLTTVATEDSIPIVTGAEGSN